MISIFDETDGLENAKPIFSYIPEISESKTLAYQMVIPDVYLPAMGGFDLSVLVLFIVLQFANFLMGDLIGPIWYQL